MRHLFVAVLMALSFSIASGNNPPCGCSAGNPDPAIFSFENREDTLTNLNGSIGIDFNFQVCPVKTVTCIPKGQSFEGA